MTRELLYYPTFLPPSDSWVKKALLFWDSFSTIVPDENLDEVSTESMKVLKALKVYKPLSPNFHSQAASEASHFLEDELISCFSDNQLKAKLKQCTPADYVLIARGKVTYRAEMLLENFGCVEEDITNFQWLRIKKPAAELYMSLLARVLSRYSQNRWLQPCTDIQVAQVRAFAGNTEAGIRISILEAIPDVNPDVSFEEILKFRSRRRDELLRFRLEIDNLQNELENVNEHGYQGLWGKWIESVELSLSDLKKASLEAGICGRFSALESLFKVNSPALLGMAVAALPLPLDSTGKLLSVGLGGLVSAYGVGIKSWQSKGREAAHPMSYYLSCHRERFFLSDS